jgi:hypothetical protein
VARRRAAPRSAAAASARRGAFLPLAGAAGVTGREAWTVSRVLTQSASSPLHGKKRVARARREALGVETFARTTSCKARREESEAWPRRNHAWSKRIEAWWKKNEARSKRNEP